MKWKDKHYIQPEFVCCSKSIVPVLKDDWMYCPKCGRPKPKSWMEKSKYVSGWLRAFAWRPTRVAGFWIWLEHYERVLSLTGVNSSAGGFEFTSVEYKRLIGATSILTVTSKGGS